MSDPTLTRAALLTLEEAVHTARYLQNPQSYPVKFALAYLHSTQPSDRRVFDDFWRALSEGSVFRGIALENSHKAIHAHLRIPRHDEDMWMVWRATFERLATTAGTGRRTRTAMAKPHPCQATQITKGRQIRFGRRSSRSDAQG